MADRRKRCPRISRAQKNILVEFMFEHREFARCQITASNSWENQSKTWELIGSKLNNEGPITKSVQQWKKCWIDIKSSAKKHHNELKEFMNRTETDGGSIEDGPRPLSDFEKQVLSIMETDSADGDGSTPEMGTSWVDNSDIAISSESDIDVKEETTSRMTTTPQPFEIAIDEATTSNHTLEEKLDQVHKQNASIIARINKIEQQNATIMAQNEEILQILEENETRNSEHQNKKLKTIGSHICERNNSKEEATIYSDSWGASFRNIKGIQKIYAKKAIEDILYLGMLGQLEPKRAKSSNLFLAAPAVDQHSVQVYQAEFLNKSQEKVKLELDDEL